MMKIEQYDIFGNLVVPPKKKTDNLRRNWENGFQKWSNEQAQDETSPLGVCGYGSMCDYCEDNTYGRPCVRALNAMCRAEGIKIDYTNKNYQKVWEEKTNESLT